jgi:hypothetical protein
MTLATREATIIAVLASYGDKGCTLATICRHLDRSGGDITKGISVLRKLQYRIRSVTYKDEFTGRRSVRYVLDTSILGVNT